MHPEQAFMERLWRERSPPLPPFETLFRPGQTPSAPPPPQQPAAPTGADSEPERKVKRIKLTGSLAGGSTGSSVPTLDNLPPIASTSSVSSAAGTPTLKLKLGGPRPTPVAAPPPRANPSPAAAPVPEHSAPAPIAPTQPDLVVGPVADIAVDSTASTSTASTTHPSAVAVTATSTVTGAGTGDDETKPAAASTVPTIADVESGWLDGPAVSCVEVSGSVAVSCASDTRMRV